MEISTQEHLINSSFQMTVSGCNFAGQMMHNSLIFLPKASIKCLKFTKTQTHLCDRKGGLWLNCQEHAGCDKGNSAAFHYRLMSYNQFTMNWINHWKILNRKVSSDLLLIFLRSFFYAGCPFINSLNLVLNVNTHN